VIGALVGLALLACGRPTEAANPSPALAADIGLSVESHFAGGLAIYLDAHGTSLRLGEVSAQGSPAFVVPWRRVGPDGVFRLRAEVIGSVERVVTEELHVQPGQLVRWKLGAILGMSSVSVH
jgi:hypothetical protein